METSRRGFLAWWAPRWTCGPGYVGRYSFWQKRIMNKENGEQVAENNGEKKRRMAGHIELTMAKMPIEISIGDSCRRCARCGLEARSGRGLHALKDIIVQMFSMSIVRVIALVLRLRHENHWSAQGFRDDKCEKGYNRIPAVTCGFVNT